VLKFVKAIEGVDVSCWLGNASSKAISTTSQTERKTQPVPIFKSSPSTISNSDTTAILTFKYMANSFDFGGSTRILVTVNGNRLTGSVSPHVMAHASPIWNKFLFPPFKKLDSSINIESNGSQSAGDGEMWVVSRSRRLLSSPCHS
jgi:hypothetical protein